MTDKSDCLPAPYYEDDFCTIYNTDCREVLPHIRADVILTDLPYGIGVDYGDTYTDTPEDLQRLIRDAVPLMLEAAPVVAFTCGVVNQWWFPRPTWVLCWYQLNAVRARAGWGFSQWQPVLVYGTDPYLARLRGARPDVVAVAVPNSGADKRLGHPCPKPIEAWRRVLQRVSPDPTDLILDPFMGSGTTLHAAKAGGRRSIGIEVNERYCEIAALRLGQEVLDFGGAA